MEQVAIDAAIAIVESAVPVAVVIELSNMLIGMFLRAAFGGRLWFGR